MFYFVVKYLRVLALVPGLPQVFDAWLVALTCLFRRSRMAAIEALEMQALSLPGVRLKVHKLGGVEFVNQTGRELGHIHGHALLDVPVGRQAARHLIAARKVLPHHALPNSIWISFQLESERDVPFAMELLNKSNLKDKIL